MFQRQQRERESRDRGREGGREKGKERRKGKGGERNMKIDHLLPLNNRKTNINSGEQN